MDNILEIINNMILDEKETLSVLPKNTKKNKEEYLKTIQELSIKYKVLKKQVVQEIKERYKGILRKNVSAEIKQIEKNLKSYEDLSILNENITSYKKMGLDEISYNLNNFQNNDLKVINEFILKGIKVFEKCNIILEPKDFEYSQYVYRYMTVFFEEMKTNINNSENIKSTFEEIYWKCPNIIKHINLNIHYLYYKNQKEIDKYYKNKYNEIINKYGLDVHQICEQYMNSKEEYFIKYNQDEAVLLDKFIFKGFDINKYNDIEIKNEYSNLVKLNIDELSENELDTLNDNIYKLANSLYEYKNYLKYIQILEDMRKRNNKFSKEEYTIEKDIKNISIEENTLMKLNSKINKFNANKNGLFTKNEKINELEQKNIIQLNKLEELYSNLEENIMNNEIKKMFAENVTIYELLVFLCYNYSYFTEKFLSDKTDIEKEEINISEEIKYLKEFLSNPQFNVLIKNLKINDDNKFENIIKDRYFLFNIEIQEEDLKPEKLDDLIESVNKIVLYNNIKYSKLSVKDIKFMCNLKKIVDSRK